MNEGYVSYILFSTSYFLIFFLCSLDHKNEGKGYYMMEEGDIFICLVHGPLSSLNTFTHSSHAFSKEG